MKLGRNDPCHCGSGKKYKRCCMDSTNKQHAQVLDEVEAIMAMNPDLTMDDLNTVVQHKIDKVNNRPHDDFCGLSPTQMGDWLYKPFEEVNELTVSTPHDLAKCPVMRYLQLILDEALLNDGKIKATSKGNLPVKVVKKANELLPEFAVSKYSRHISICEFAGSNEDKFNALHYTRVLAELSGIIYLRSGHINVKKDAQKQYQKHGLQVFFKPMLTAAISQYNWAYLDGYEVDIDLRHIWLFMLWRIQHHASLNQLIAEVIRAFPMMMEPFPTDRYFSAQELLGMVIASRFIQRFLQFWGFVVINPLPFAIDTPKERNTENQPLFAQTFKFSV